MGPWGIYGAENITYGPALENQINTDQVEHLIHELKEKKDIVIRG